MAQWWCLLLQSRQARELRDEILSETEISILLSKQKPHMRDYLFLLAIGDQLIQAMFFLVIVIEILDLLLGFIGNHTRN